MEDRSQLSSAVTKAFAQIRQFHANSRMYEELALQHLSSATTASRLKVAHLVCPISHAQESMIKALANGHAQMTGKYVALNSRSTIATLRPAVSSAEP